MMLMMMMMMTMRKQAVEAVGQQRWERKQPKETTAHRPIVHAHVSRNAKQIFCQKRRLIGYQSKNERKQMSTN
jgi:hypothetical protein